MRTIKSTADNWMAVYERDTILPLICWATWEDIVETGVVLR